MGRKTLTRPSSATTSKKRLTRRKVWNEVWRRRWYFGAFVIAVISLWLGQKYEAYREGEKKRLSSERMRKSFAEREKRRSERIKERKNEADHDDQRRWAELMAKGDSLATRGSSTNLEEAISLYREAVALVPRLSPGHANLANALMRAGRFEEAVEATRTAIGYATTPREESAARINLGAALSAGQGAKTKREALDIFVQAAELDNSSITARSYAANAALALGYVDQAKSMASAALDLDPTDPAANALLMATADALFPQGDLAEFREDWETHLTTAVSEAENATQAALLAFDEEVEEAKEDPDFNDEAIKASPELIRILDTAADLFFVKSAFLVRDALGDTTKNIDEAIIMLEKANAMKLDAITRQRDTRAWSPAASSAAATTVIGAFSAEAVIRTLSDIRAQSDTTESSPAPLFIVGSPRAGASLLSSMLGQSPEIAIRDPERVGLGDAVSRYGVAAFRGDDDIVDAVADFYRKGNIYLEDNESAPATYAMDTTIDNVWWLGAAAYALRDPRIRIIVIKRRDAKAQAFSIWKTDFSQSGREWSYQPEALTARLRALERLEMHWLAVLPSANIKLVYYEDLVANPQSTLEDLFTNFLELSQVHPDCLKPNELPSALPHPQNTATVRSDTIHPAKSYSALIDSIPFLANFDPSLPDLFETLQASQENPDDIDDDDDDDAAPSEDDDEAEVEQYHESLDLIPEETEDTEEKTRPKVEITPPSAPEHPDNIPQDDHEEKPRVQVTITPPSSPDHPDYIKDDSSLPAPEH